MTVINENFFYFVHMSEIVITDGYTLNPGDLSWDDLQELGNLRIFERTNSNEMLTRCRDASVIVTNKTPIRENVINQ